MHFNASNNNETIEPSINNRIVSCIIKQFIFILVLFIILLIILPQFSWNEDEYLLCLSWIGNITFIISLYLYYKATNSFICPYVVFFFSFFCFHFGQDFLYSLGIKYDYIHLGFYSTLWDNNSEIFINGTIMIIFSIAIFNLGALCSLINRNSKKKLLYSSSRTYISNKAIRTCGWILFLTTIIPTFYSKINEMRVSVQYGYSGIYSQLGGAKSFMNSFSILFIPSCILLLIGYKNNRIIKNLIMIISVVVAFIGLIGGGRTEGISILLVIILYRLLIGKTITFKKALPLIISIFLVMSLVVSFSQFRGVENKTGNEFVSTFIETVTDRNPLFNTIGEMGWSMGTVFMTMKIVPNHIQYEYGKTYFCSLSRFIPTSIDPTGVIDKLHKESYKASNLITDFYKMSFGTDSTLVAESYYNFGYYGIIAIFIIGIIIGKLLGYSSKTYIKSNGIASYVKLAGVYSIFTLPRRHLGYLITQVSYVIILVIVIIKIIEYRYYIKYKNRVDKT